MIAKLIVRGHSRTVAIQKMQSALQQYEIAGLVTNIEFLKGVCNHASFIDGEVETGFIAKHRDDLFAETPIPPELYAQAALGCFFLATALNKKGEGALFDAPPSGFGTGTHRKFFKFAPSRKDGMADAEDITVEISVLNTGLFDLRVAGMTYHSVASRWNSQSRQITTFFPHTRLDTRIIDDEGNLTLFQQGHQYRLQCAAPRWVEKALGVKDTAYSVLSPMPCKILRVEVSVGDEVKKDQVLVVIESMKMETVIRSPQSGVISKVVHQQVSFPGSIAIAANT